MLIWILMSVGLVVIVAGGFVGRARRDRYRSSGHHDGTQPRPTTARRNATAGAGAVGETGPDRSAVLAEVGPLRSGGGRAAPGRCR